jgi:hypothetical protein
MTKTKPALNAEIYALEVKVKLLRAGLWQIVEEYTGKPVSEWALKVLDYKGEDDVARRFNMSEIQRCDLTRDGLRDWLMTDVDDGRYVLYTDHIAALAEKDKLLEYERIRLAACGVAAMANTIDTIKQRINPDNTYWSASYGDICSAVDRQVEYRDQIAVLQARIKELEGALSLNLAVADDDPILTSSSEEMQCQIDRTHEECVDCVKEYSNPPECRGHKAGPSSCSRFLERDSDAICEALDTEKQKTMEAREAFGEKAKELADTIMEYEEHYIHESRVPISCGGTLEETTQDRLDKYSQAEFADKILEIRKLRKRVDELEAKLGGGMEEESFTRYCPIHKIGIHYVCSKCQEEKIFAICKTVLTSGSAEIECPIKEKK